MYEFWYVCKTKYGAKATFCCMDTDSFTVCIKTNNIYTKKMSKILQKMLKLNLILQIVNEIDHYQKEKIKK